MEVVDPSLEDVNTSIRQTENSKLGGRQHLNGSVESSNNPRQLRNKRFSRLADNVAEDSIIGKSQQATISISHFSAKPDRSSLAQNPEVVTPGGGTMGLGALLAEARREGNSRTASSTEDVQMLDNEAWLI